MKSPFANIFLAMQQRIATEAPDIAHIAHDLGQLSLKGRLPVSWPCALVDFEDFTFGNLAENIQTAVGTVVITLGFATHSSTAQNTPDAYREKAVSYYDTEWALHRALQGWCPLESIAGALVRTSATTQKRSDGYRVRELRYRLAFEDYSTKNGLTYAPAVLVVGSEMKG